jgi:hypothetical protein
MQGGLFPLLSPSHDSAPPVILVQHARQFSHHLSTAHAQAALHPALKLRNVARVGPPEAQRAIASV